MTLASMLNMGFKTAFPAFFVPKEVKIRNHRLSLLHRLLLLGTLIFVLWLLTGDQTYLKIEEPTGSVAYWIASTDAEYEEKATEDFESELCQNPERFDYLYSSGWEYTNYSCTDIHRHQRYRKEGDSSIFFPTSFDETIERRRLLSPDVNASDPEACASLAESCASGWRKVRVSSGVACDCWESGKYFIVGFESLALGIEHYYAMVREASGELHSRQSSGAICVDSQDDNGSSYWKCDYEAHPLKTAVYVRTRSGDETLVQDGVFVSPEPINLHLATILSAAGYSLNSQNTQTLQNGLYCGNSASDPNGCRPGAMQFPALRLTGMEVHLTMKYFNSFYRPNYPEVQNHPGPSCVIIVSVIPKWSSRPTVDCSIPFQATPSDRDCVSRYTYGVSLSIESSGSFAFWDMMQMALAIGAALSYFTLPFAIVHFIAMKCLGPLSKFYEQAADEELRVDDEIVTCMTQSLSAAASFRVLCDGDEGLDKAKVLQEIRTVFKDRADFDLGQQAELAELVWDRLSRSRKDLTNQSESNKAGDDEAEGAAEARMSGEKEDMILLPQFVHSLASRTLSAQVLNLFDHKRCRNPFEIIFAPRGQLKVTESFARNENGEIDEDSLSVQIREEKNSH